MYLRCDPTDGSWWVIIANKGKRLIQTMNNKILYASVGPTRTRRPWRRDRAPTTLTHTHTHHPLRIRYLAAEGMGPHAAEIFYACGAVCKVSAPAREAGRREAEWSGAPYWWGIVGVVRPKSLMPTTPHGPQRLESFMLGVPSRQRSNLLCVGRHRNAWDG